MNDFTSGSVEAFRTKWADPASLKRYHFTRGAPLNQVQFAFQNHWRVFRRYLPATAGRFLEVGCGRGSLGAFFAEAGYAVHLLDTAADALEAARVNFERDQLKATYTVGDALAMPYPDGMFNVVGSIGLLEHFEDIERPIAEQYRVLAKDGVLLVYVVPERKWCVQVLAIPVNALLKLGHACWLALRGIKRDPIPKGTPLYRNAFPASDYLAILKKLGSTRMGSFGMFPLPLVSHSPSFPFSPMSPHLEGALMHFWRFVLGVRRLFTKEPWICAERTGLAFLVWAVKE